VVGETVILLLVEALFHEYDPPPVAVKVADAPWQIEVAGVIVTVGAEATVTFTAAEAEVQFSYTVTV
jgi:hypothetical protein